MIRRIRFRNWRGITAREVVIGPGGVLIEGTNGSGKTSFITGIRAALMGRGVDETAVHVGTDEAELLVDLDHATVRRVLKANGSGGLSITLDDGTKQSSPQAWLNDLLGIAPLDPIDLFEEKDAAKRRAKVLAAMPISVTPEILAQWLPPGETATKAECAGHGLDVVERLRKAVYERRTEAGRVLKNANAAVSTAALKLATAEAEIGPGEIREVAVVDNALNVAIREQVALETQAESAAKQTAQAEATRKKVADFRAKAAELRERAAKDAPDPAVTTELLESRGVLNADAESWEKKIAELQEQIAEAEAQRATCRDAIATIDVELRKREEAEALAEASIHSATEFSSRAEELEATIASATPPSAEAIEEKRIAVAALRKELERSRSGGKLGELRATLEKVKGEEAAAKAAHVALDASEKALKHDAPKALLAASGGVPGLTVDGDVIRLDGVALDTLSGAEQLRFAVAIARRMNAKSKLLVIDKLEAVAPDQLADFIAHATADGFQLIATRVAEGPATAKAIGGGA